MERLEQSLEELRQKKYNFNSFKRLSGGINNAVYRVGCNQGINYALKIYPKPTLEDPRNRCRTEANFLHYLHSCAITNAPSLQESNEKNGWSLLSWIDGQRLKKLDQSDIKGVTEFVSRINCQSKINERKRLALASDCHESLLAIIASIGKRIKNFHKVFAPSLLEVTAIEWIANTIEPHFKMVSSELINTRADCAHWNNYASQKIASPSDVGIHNMLKTKGELVFLDFEYAGLDDLSKLAADWTLQPESKLDEKKEEIFINYLLRGMPNHIDDSWVERFNDIKELSHIKWCLIMLNSLHNRTLSMEQLNKTKNYYYNNKERLSRKN